MEKIHYSIIINAPKQKVWETMLDKETYSKWTNIFNPDAGSYFEGSWETGKEIRFYGLEKNGLRSGMLSKIKEARPYDFMSIEHIGEIHEEKEHVYSDQEKEGGEFLENYTFNEKDGGTELLIDIDTKQEYKEMFEEMWPKALEVLKQLAEE